MKTILIKSLKRVTVKSGKRRALINSDTWISEGQFNQAVPQGLSDVNLIGSTLTVEFYAEGEELVTGEECTASNTIVKSVSIQPSMDAQIASSVAATLAARYGIAPKAQTPATPATPTPVVPETVVPTEPVVEDIADIL